MIINRPTLAVSQETFRVLLVGNLIAFQNPFTAKRTQGAVRHRPIIGCALFPAVK